MTVFTIGHYNHSQETFLALLATKEIDCVVDVRSMPGSNRNPHFNKDQLQEWLERAYIDYFHLPKLGGRRSRSGEVGEVLNDGWENQSFHNYADYTLSESFKQGIGGGGVTYKETSCGVNVFRASSLKVPPVDHK
ncbi:hypothetical protein JCM21714_4603 [Gracilibacillus boraciitolerans JCM 21714]|uniref:DUF488 domain-containing protein n=1 Tax=Gracilibacillus boraciitolerans JCM 21714 TaxID=1298598 RepID=W4VQA1_9BACI|nr:DUF488 domain-containing protein [Gracilibacillus boraciitolerans]GAE95371.1 hypothetical protein JCM21714_4603 [Gracilibacillus boraciitolerans JCM 21714]